MSAAIKSQLTPALEALGFVGTHPCYRRERRGAVQLLAVLYDKSATHFCLEFGAHGRGDKLTSWSEVVPESRLLLEHVRFDSRARLQHRNGGSLAENRFSFGAFSEESQFHELARSVAQFLPQADQWLETGCVGPIVSAMKAAGRTEYS